MKKVLLALFIMIGFGLSAQSLEVNELSSGVQFIKLSTSDTSYYSNNTQGWCYVKSNGTAYFYSKAGGQISVAYPFNEVSVNDSVYATREDFLTAINAIPFFSSLAPSGGGIDSGEVIGNFLYLFSDTDTTIIDMSTLAGGDSIWSVSGGVITQTDTSNHLLVEGSNADIVNGTITPFALPFTGVISDSIGTWFGLNGLLNFFGTPMYVNGHYDFTNFKYNGTRVIDTSEYLIDATNAIRLNLNEDESSSFELTKEDINMNTWNGKHQLKFYGYNGKGAINQLIEMAINDTTKGVDIQGFYADTLSSYMQTSHNVSGSNWDNTLVQTDSTGVYLYRNKAVGTTGSTQLTAKLTDDGFVIPSVSSNPTGEEGAVIYNTTDSLLLTYEKGAWIPLVHPNGWARYDNTTYNSGSPLTILQGDTQTLYFDSCMICDYLPYGVDSMYNRADSTFITDRVGNTYLWTLDFNAENSNVSGYGQLMMDIGGAPGIIFSRLNSFPKGANTEHEFSSTNFVYTLDTFLANGGRIRYYSAVGDTDMWDIQLRIKKL